MTNAHDILKAALIDQGYDGLYYPGECGCRVGDLVPCCESPMDCLPGYLREGDGDDEYGWSIGPREEDATDGR